MLKVHRKMKTKVVTALLLVALSACGAPASPTAISTSTKGNALSTSSPVLPSVNVPPVTATPASSPTPTLNPYSGPVKIYGHVTDENGNPLVTNVVFDAFNVGDQGYVITDPSGYYEKTLPDALQYIVSIDPARSAPVGKYSFPSGLLSQRKLVVRNGPETRLDFTLGEAGTLWLQSYNQQGNEMGPGDYVNASMIGAYPQGAYPDGGTYEFNGGGYSVRWGLYPDWNLYVACLLLPPGKPADIWAVWRLPEVGTTYLHADNNGNGFSVEKGIVTPVNLVYEFARTEYRKSFQQYQDLVAAGSNFTDDIPTWFNSAKQELKLAENLHQGGLESASALQAYQVLTKVIQAREQFTLEQARADIEKYRMGNLRVNLTDNQGRPITNARVDYQQASHDFVFSIAWPSEAQYQALRAAGFEYASFESWWGEIEKADGVYSFPDAAVASLEKAGFGIVMHAAVWPSPAYLPATPSFLAGASPAELSAQAGQYSFDILNHYKNQIKLYNAFNEPDGAQAYQFTLDELVKMVGVSLQGAKKGDPSTAGFVNISMPIFQYISRDGGEYSVAYDMYGHAKPGEVNFASPAASPTQFLQALASAGYNPDTIGLEYYYGVVLPPIDLGLFAGSLDHYGTFGKKLFISELSYGTLDDYPGVTKSWSSYGGWHQGYTDQAQADWARDAITIAYSKPFVNGVQWTGAGDGPVDYNYVGDGLFHSDGVTPRQSLKAIGEAIQSWTTQGSGTTDTSGALALRGYGGYYALKITTADGRTLHGRVHITEQADDQATLTLDGTPPVINSATVSSQVAKNGEYLEIKISADATTAGVSVDVSQLDSTRNDPLLLEKGPDGVFTTKFAVSVLNSASNGTKKLPISVEDSVGNVSTTSLEIELNNPALLLDAVPPDDSFTGKVLDPGKWILQVSPGGTVTQDGRLIVSVASSPANASARIQSSWAFPGDFDIQVDFEIGTGWSMPAQEHLDGAMLGITINGHVYHITRLRSTNQDLFFAWSDLGTLTRNWPTTVTSGKYRLVRTGTNLFVLYDDGSGWQELDSVAVPSSPAKVYMGNGSVNAAQAFTTYFDNFKINSGLTTYKP